MSVYASQRSEARVEYIRVAQELAVYSLKQTKKFPKSFRFSLTNEIVKLAMEIHEYALRGNSIFVHKAMSDMEFQLRQEYLTKARSALFALSSLLTITFALVLEGNNFLGDKQQSSRIFKEWATLINREAALIKGVIKSDNRRYESYQTLETEDLDEVKNSDSDDELLLEKDFDIPESDT